MIVTIRHLRSVPGFSRRPGFCSRGARQLAATYGLDFGDFARNGIASERLEATGDPFALALVQWARTCEAQAGASQEAAAHG